MDVAVHFAIGLICMLAFLFAGCYVAEQVVQLNNLSVDGQVHQVPIRVNDNDMSGHLRLTPVFELMPKRNLDGVLQIGTNKEISSLPQYDTTTNLRWNFPSYVAGLSADYGLSKIISFSAGGNYSQVDGKHFFEWDLGLGLCFDGENSGGRLEAGLQWENIWYRATFDKYEVDHYIFGGEDSVKYLYSFSSNGNRSNVNFYVNLTLNTKFHSSPVNGFVRIGYGSTSLVDNDVLSGQEQGDVSQSVSFISLTPGLFLDIGEWNRIVLGCQFISPSSLNTSNPEWLISPMIQLDFTF